MPPKPVAVVKAFLYNLFNYSIVMRYGISMNINELAR